MQYAIEYPLDDYCIARGFQKKHTPKASFPETRFEIPNWSFLLALVNILGGLITC